MKNKIQDVRDILIAQMEAIRDAENPKEIETAIAKGRALSELGKTITDSARVEVEALQLLGAKPGAGTGFIPLSAPALPQPKN